MTETWLVIAGLASGTYAIRFGGYLIGAALPTEGPWARALSALPGCLLAALLAVILAQAGPAEWLAASICLAVALATRSLPLTMLAGVLFVGLSRSL